MRAPSSDTLADIESPLPSGQSGAVAVLQDGSALKSGRLTRSRGTVSALVMS